MILTLYYMYATVLQWWRLGVLKNKLIGTMNSHNAILVCTGNTISDQANRRCLENLLFHHDDRIGCTVVPRQQVDLCQWAAFPKDYNYFPLYIGKVNNRLEMPKVFLLFQAQLSTYEKHHSEIIQVENFGELVAWRAKDTFDVILKTDMLNLAKLINSFSDHSLDINHELKLVRIETIDVEGNPIKIKFASRYSLERRLKYSFAPVHWSEFAADVKTLYSKVKYVAKGSGSNNSSLRTLDKPTIKIEEEPVKKVPISEVKPITKENSASPSKRHRFHSKESKNQLDVVTAPSSRSKSTEKKKVDKVNKEAGDHKKREEKRKDERIKDEKKKDKRRGVRRSEERIKEENKNEKGVKEDNKLEEIKKNEEKRKDMKKSEEQNSVIMKTEEQQHNEMKKSEERNKETKKSKHRSEEISRNEVKNEEEDTENLQAKAKAPKLGEIKNFSEEKGAKKENTKKF